MPRSVAVLRPEGRSERVDAAERAGEDFALQLAAHGEERWPMEKVLGEVDLAVGSRRFVGVQGRDAEHRARPFAVAGGDDRRVDVQEPLFLEELMDRVANAVPHPRDRPERIGPWPQMSPFAELLERMLFFLERIGFGIGPAMDFDAAGPQFGGLSFAARRRNRPVHGHAAAHAEPLHIGLVVRQTVVGDHLQVGEARSVVHFQEAEAALGVSSGADPALDPRGSPNRRRFPGRSHAHAIHR